MSAVDVQALDHVQMEVADLEESQAFYERHLGLKLFETGLRFGLRWAIIGKPGSIFLCLHENKGNAGKKNAGIKITHFGIVVRDFEGAQRHFASAAIKLDPPNGFVSYERSRSFYFFDPNGYKVEVSEHWGGGNV